MVQIYFILYNMYYKYIYYAYILYTYYIYTIYNIYTNYYIYINNIYTLPITYTDFLDTHVYFRASRLYITWWGNCVVLKSLMSRLQMNGMREKSEEMNNGV